MKHTFQSFAIFTFSFCGALLAAEPPADVTELPPLEVQSTPFGGRTADELVQPVDVLAGDELERRRAGTLGETLGQELGISNSGFGPGVGRPVIRGQGGNRVRILENGIGSMDVSDVSGDHAVTLDPAHAQQIEVLKGPSTLLYGSSAYAGVINLVDDRLSEDPEDGTHLFVDGSYGENGDDKNGRFGLHSGNGLFKFHLDGASRRNNDYDIPGFADRAQTGTQGRLTNSFVETDSGSLSAAYTGLDAALGGALSFYKSAYGLPNEPPALIEMEQTRFDLRGTLRAPFDGIEALRVQAGVNDYQHTEFPTPGIAGTRFSNDEIETRFELTHSKLGPFTGAVGTQLIFRDFAAVGTETFVPPTKTDSIALFAVEELPVSFGTFEFGGRIEQVRHAPDAGAGNPLKGGSVDRDYTPLSVSAGLLVKLGETHHLRLNLGRSQRAPGAEELFAFGAHEATEAFERGDANLKKETADNLELSLDRHVGRWTWSAAVFYTQHKDYIFSREVDCNLNADDPGACNPDGTADRVLDDGTFDAVNGEFKLLDNVQADAAFYGAEAETRFALIQEGPFKLGSRLFADSVRGELKSGGDLPRVTPTRIGAGLDATMGAFTGSVDVTGVRDQRRVSSLETPTAGFTLLAADLGYAISLGGERALTFYLRGRNLLDEEVRNHVSFIKDAVTAPGRAFFGGVRFDFGA